jgi:hypothetical protein
MPGSYRCPKGEKHDWQNKVDKNGNRYRECRLCHQIVMGWGNQKKS